MIAAAAGLVLQLAGVAIPADSVERLRSEARKAEAAFERLSRRLVPTRYGVDGSSCDEIVGRFCLLYDEGQPYVPGPEHGQVVDARREAIEALRAAFNFLPGDLETAAPLVRYLVEDDRSPEAASAARMFEIESGDSLWGPLLRGFAAHAASSDSVAEHLFQLALDRMAEAERNHVLDIDWVIDAEDRGAYRKLTAQARSAYAARFWALADPLYLTAGNESWVEHVARHVYGRMLERAPRVADMMRWGVDLEQLTIRYGVPVARTRSPGSMMNDGPITEHYDPDQLAYTPGPILRKGLTPPPLPGRPWELDRARSRTGYAPATVRKLEYLPHQLTLFPADSGWTLRVDGLFVKDSIAAGSPAHLATGLFLSDTTGRPMGAVRDTLAAPSDTTVVAMEIDAPRADGIYSLEVVELGTRLARRARYSMEHETGPIRLSDPLITFAWSPGSAPADRKTATFRPRANLVVLPTDTLGLYAEVSGLSPGNAYRVRLSIEPAGRGSLPGRIVSWIGDRLGVSEPDAPARIEWSALSDANGHAILAVELFPVADRTGDQVITLRILEPGTGRGALTRRLITVREGSD